MNRTILIVDDDSLITTTLSTLIELSSDYRVLAFNNPKEALESLAVKSNAVDLVISDFLMPEMSGLEFLKELKAHVPNVVTILLTGYADKQNAIRCINELGIYYYLEKPWDNADLLKIIQNGLEKKELEEELKRKNEALTKWSRQLEIAVAARTAALQNLLDNAGQGFLSFGSDLVIRKEFSQECVKIFGLCPDSRSFPELVFPEEPEQRSFIISLLNKLLEEENPLKHEVYFSLLPTEVSIQERTIEMSYKLLPAVEHAEEAPGFMVILTDVTEKRKLEAERDHEEQILKMVVKAVIHYSDLMEAAGEFYQFCNHDIHALLSSHTSVDDMLFEIFRSVHTFKGIFSQLDLMESAYRLHLFETEISAFRNSPENKTVENLRHFIEGHTLSKWLDKDIETLKSYLGEDFFKQRDLLFITKAKVVELEKKVLSMVPYAQFQSILSDIRALRYRPIRDLFKSYPDYVKKLSDKLEKPMEALVIEGGTELVDADRYSYFAKALVHVFRNIMDHGIEHPDERSAAGKSYSGNVHCRFKVKGNTVMLSIRDDGRGIDPEKIKIKALEKGFISSEESEALSRDQLINLIFTDGFTTSEQVSELSGRGMGLSAVKKELERLGGTVTVKTVPGQGTEFVFLMPYEDISNVPAISVTAIMNPLIEGILNLVYEIAEVKVTSVDNFRIEKPDMLPMQQINSFIAIRGALKGMFVISADKRLAESITQGFLIGETEENAASYIEDMMAEFANIVLGNSIKLFPGLENLVTINPPITITSEQAYMKYPQSKIWTCCMQSELGDISLSFITFDDVNVM